jgi:2-methylcitrate dehydratase
LLNRISVRPDAALTARYPESTPVRIAMTLRNGQQVSREQEDFEGARSRPFTWDRTVEKLHWLAEQYADDGLRGAIVDTVGHLDEAPVSALTGLLAQVSQQRRPTTASHEPA